MAAQYPHAVPIVTVQPGVFTPDPFRAMTNEWSSGFCDCCNNVGQCICAYFCFSCFVCKLAKKIDESVWSCLCLPNALAVYRMKVRTAYKIKGDSCDDHCAAGCCGLCVAMQIDNELRARGIN